MTQADMHNPLINSYRQAEDYFFRSISIECLDTGEGVTAYMTGVPVKSLNVVYVKQEAIATEDTFIHINRFYDLKNLDFELMVPEELCQQGMYEFLRIFGYYDAGKSVAMVLTLESRNTAPFNDEVIIQPTNANLTDWMIPLIEAFDSTPEITSIYAHCHETAMSWGSELYHFTLYVLGRPISSITLSVQGSIARIDDMGTLPEFQGKGYATCLVNHALSEASKLGATHCFLESSDSGLTIYQKIGFDPLFQNRVYSRQKPD